MSCTPRSRNAGLRRMRPSGFSILERRRRQRPRGGGRNLTYGSMLASASPNRRRLMRRTVLVSRIAAVVMVASAAPLAAQAAKKVLTQGDWDKWKSINAPTLSNDGKWAVYTLIPQVGDGELVIRSTSGTTEYRVPRGYIGRPNNIPGGLRGPAGGTGEADPAGPTATPAQITPDSRYVIVSTQPSQAEVMRAPRGRGAAANRQSLAIVSLADGKVTTIAGVRSFRVARDNGTWLAYVPGADSATGDSTARAPAVGRGRGGRGAGAGA